MISSGKANEKIQASQQQKQIREQVAAIDDALIPADKKNAFIEFLVVKQQKGTAISTDANNLYTIYADEFYILYERVAAIDCELIPDNKKIAFVEFLVRKKKENCIIPSDSTELWMIYENEGKDNIGEENIELYTFPHPAPSEKRQKLEKEQKIAHANLATGNSKYTYSSFGSLLEKQGFVPRDYTLTDGEVTKYLKTLLYQNFPLCDQYFQCKNQSGDKTVHGYVASNIISLKDEPSDNDQPLYSASATFSEMISNHVVCEETTAYRQPKVGNGEQPLIIFQLVHDGIGHLLLLACIITKGRLTVHFHDPFPEPKQTRMSGEDRGYAEMEKTIYEGAREHFNIKNIEITPYYHGFQSVSDFLCGYFCISILFNCLNYYGLKNLTSSVLSNATPITMLHELILQVVKVNTRNEKLQVDEFGIVYDPTVLSDPAKQKVYEDHQQEVKDLLEKQIKMAEAERRRPKNLNNTFFKIIGFIQHQKQQENNKVENTAQKSVPQIPSQNSMNPILRPPATKCSLQGISLNLPETEKSTSNLNPEQTTEHSKPCLSTPMNK